MTAYCKRLWCWLFHDKVRVVGPHDTYRRCHTCGNEFWT